MPESWPSPPHGRDHSWRNLTVGASGAVLAGPVTLAGVLTLNGDFATTALPFTLLSDASGTAMVVNNGSFAVVGRATVQRYITLTNAGLGYRHYSSPVANSFVADFTTSNFTPVVNPAYNSAAAPGSVTPFPTVFGYDESRLASSPAVGISAFDKGWQSPTALADALLPTAGYTVNLPAAATVSLSGSLNNGLLSATNLTRGTDPAAGWQLLGNPYPAPLNWDLLTSTGLDNALYVFKSSSQYGGQYAAYVNGVGTNGGTNVLPAMQGFFVRTTTAGTPGSLRFDNAARLTSYTNPVFQRGSSATDPLVRLALQPATGPADEAVVYFDAAATAGFDPTLDAAKMPAATGPGLAVQTGAQPLAISALPPLGAADVLVPLTLTAALSGPATLGATELLNLPAGTHAWLLDAVRGSSTDLTLTPTYAFAPTTAAADATRFSVRFSSRAALAAGAALTAAEVLLYPNPAHGAATLRLPTTPPAPCTLTLHDALGRRVWQGQASGSATDIPLAGLAPGVYALQIGSAAGTVTRRLVVE